MVKKRENGKWYAVPEHQKLWAIHSIVNNFCKFPLLAIYPTEMKTYVYTKPRMLIKALFRRAEKWKQPKCPSTDGWINKMWSIRTMKYNSAIKRNEVEKYDSDDPWKHYAKSNKLVAKDHILYDSI